MGPLDEYRRKRDFETTPEPSGSESVTAAGLSFVVQKHAASRLHWDFRLELDGVLLSWAVPKGPSLDPSDKRLAMRVEDHPVAYGAFEGVIPAGEYGGGTVMLWDRGSWEPDHGDPREHLAEGHLKFHLFGERLRGRWMLVKTKGYGGKSENSWLLFKERDEEARPAADFDSVREWTTSVASGRTMDEIAERAETYVAPEATSKGVRPIIPERMPGAVPRPMDAGYEVELATLVDRIPEGERWLHEIKYDGYRIVARLEHGSARLVSRNGRDWTDRFPGIASAIAALPVTDAVLDGEVVAFDGKGRSDFQALQEATRSHATALHYMAFDLLHLNGFDLRAVPLEQRKELLSALVPRHSDLIRYTDHIEGHGDVLFDRACGLELEGVVSKRRDSPYRGGRGRDWLKAKCLLRQEFAVVGFTEPSSGRERFGALILAVASDGEYRTVGRVGTGFSDASLRTIESRLQALEIDDAPVENPPTGAEARGVHWVRPELVAEVSFAEWTRSGQLRHPSFLGLREDKSPGEAAVEVPVAAIPDQDGAAEEPGPAQSRRIGGVTLSHANRVLWPEAGFTKADLATHFERVTELMLPHVSGRPLSLVRCPKGLAGECFYQKHAENFPPEVPTVPIADSQSGAPVPYAFVSDLESIVGLVQMGVVEIHCWGSRTDDPDRPDRMIFDLDPDTTLPFSAVRASALLLRSELARLGLDSWVKTTGGKGLHVVVPLRRRHSWAEVGAFSRTFVDSIVDLDPRLFTANMSKAQRVGRIYLDHLRNRRGATTIAVYSTRARQGTPVALPIRWDELEALDDPATLTAASLGDWLAPDRNDPWMDMLSSRQSLTQEMRKRIGAP